MRQGYLAFSTVVLMFASGCVGSQSASETVDDGGSAAPEVHVDDSTGAIQGLVTDDSLAPIVGADVALQDQDRLTKTDTEGRFVFNGLAPGAYVLLAQRLGYTSTAKAVQVAAGEATEVNVQLVALSVEEAYYVIQRGVGRFGCGLAIRPAAAVALCGITYGTPLNSSDKFRVDFHLTAENISKVKSLILESEWRSTQAMSGGFDMYWETFQVWGTGTTYTETVRRIARASGNSPLKAETDDDAMRSNFKQWNAAGQTPPKYCVRDGKCSIYARAFPYAGTLGPSAPADVSIYLDQPFTHWVTEFFGEYAPEDFTVLKDA